MALLKRLKPAALFAGDAVETKRAEALAAVDLYVSRLSIAHLDDPATPAAVAEHCLPRPPRLGGEIRFRAFEAELMQRAGVARPQHGWGALLELSVPFSGSRDFFTLRSGAAPLAPPHAVIGRGSLELTASTLGGDADGLIDKLDEQLDVVRRELDDQRRRCEAMRHELVDAARNAVDNRKRRLATLRSASRTLIDRGWRLRESR